MKPILLRDVKGVFRQIPKSNLPRRLIVIESHKDEYAIGIICFAIGVATGILTFNYLWK